MSDSVFVRYRRPEGEKSASIRRGLVRIIILLFGFALGLAITWEIYPLGELDTSPAALGSEYKDDYRFLIASAFSNSGDLNRAMVRLSLLDDPDPVRALIEQAKREITNGSSQQRILSLSALTYALQIPLSLSPSPSSIFTSTSNPPTATPLPFRLISREIICDPDATQGLIRIQIQDNMGLPLAGVEVFVTSEKGEQHIYTGLKPGMGNGYADLVMSLGSTYNLKVIPSSKAIEDLQIPECLAKDGTTYGGGYKLIFGQP